MARGSFPERSVVDKLFTVADLRQILQTVYPEVDDDRDEASGYDHPMAAVGLVLLSAAIIETKELVLFTGLQSALHFGNHVEQ
jgi:hypothetical protein